MTAPLDGGNGGFVHGMTNGELIKDVRNKITITHAAASIRSSAPHWRRRWKDTAATGLLEGEMQAFDWARDYDACLAGRLRDSGALPRHPLKPPV